MSHLYLAKCIHRAGKRHNRQTLKLTILKLLMSILSKLNMKIKNIIFIFDQIHP